MTQRLVAIALLAILASWFGLAAAQAPDHDKEPVRLKKKAEPQKKPPAAKLRLVEENGVFCYNYEKPIHTPL